MRTVVLLRGGHEEDHEREAAQQSGLSMNKALDLYVPLWEEVLT